MLDRNYYKEPPGWMEEVEGILNYGDYEDEDEYNFVQTTMMGEEGKTFRDALRSAEKMAHAYGLSDMVYGDLDINAFGKRGVYHKSNSVKVLNIILLREYKDPKGRKIYTATPVTSEK